MMRKKILQTLVFFAPFFAVSSENVSAQEVRKDRPCVFQCRSDYTPSYKNCMDRLNATEDYGIFRSCVDTEIGKLQACVNGCPPAPKKQAI